MGRIVNYLTNDDLKQQMNNRIEMLKSVINCKKNDLKKAPAGNIRIVKSERRIQYYLILEKGDTNGKYLPEKRRTLVKKIIQRQYDVKVLAELEKQLKALEKCFKTYKPERVARIYMSLKTQRRIFVESVILEQSSFGNVWMEEAFDKKEGNKESLKLKTCYGEWVRSKSEVIIAEILHKKKIPFKYEMPVKLNNYTIYPDFYCFNLKTGEFIIWEHFGMLENSEYAAKTVKKIHEYQKAGYFPGKNLIISMESKDLPLSSMIVEQIINEYF